MLQNGSTHRLLICDDDPIFHLNFKQLLKSQYSIQSAYNGDEAIAIVKNHPIDLILLDVHMRKPKEGLQYITKLLSEDPDLAIIISSSDNDFRVVREAMKRGAADYILKDIEPDELTHTLKQVLERQSLIKRQGQQNFETLAHHKQHVLVGNSKPIQELKRVIEKVRKSSANVLVFGETGTGKELVARQLRHTLANGALAPFVSIDSGTIQNSTAESVLFGHERGAFTGADKLTKGIFEEADGGVVYFDEISNMPLSIQPKLLRVLQEKEISRLGSTKTIQLDFRVICATNKDLEKMSDEGEFMDDLLQRLNVLPVQIPPLRERTEDIPVLIQHFIAKQSRQRMTFHPHAIQVLQAYSWPGNVRELGNLVAYLVTMADGDQIQVSDLPSKFTTHSHSSPTSKNLESRKDRGSVYEKVAQFEKEFLMQEYQKHEGRITKLAASLKMDRSHLYTKLKQHGILGRRSRQPQKKARNKSG